MSGPADPNRTAVVPIRNAAKNETISATSVSSAQSHGAAELNNGCWVVTTA